MADNPPSAVGENVEAKANTAPSGGVIPNAGINNTTNGKTNVGPAAAPPPAPKPKPKPKAEPKQPQEVTNANAKNHTHAEHHQSKPEEGMKTGAKMPNKNHGHDESKNKNLQGTIKNNQIHHKMEKHIKQKQKQNHHHHDKDSHHEKGEECHCDKKKNTKNEKSNKAQDKNRIHKHMSKESIRKGKESKNHRKPAKESKLEHNDKTNTTSANGKGDVNSGTTEEGQVDASTIPKPPAK